MKAIYAFLAWHAAGHGTMLIPPAREAGVNTTPGNRGACENGACMWFNQGCTIGCDCNEDNDFKNFFSSECNTTQNATVNDPEYRTFNIHNQAVYPYPSDWSYYHPWRAPGTAKLLNPCGLSGGSTKNNDVAGGYGWDTIVGVQGYPGTSLPPVKYKTIWQRGTNVEVAWGIAANHGGGYQYRLCPKESDLTEECFQKNPLSFSQKTQVLKWMNGDWLLINATLVPVEDSTWMKNPIPACDDPSGGFKGTNCDNNPTFPPPRGCNETCWGYQPCYYGEFPDGCPGPIKTTEIPAIYDTVHIPIDLTPGDYVVGFRWDCEHTPQVWSSCGDVTIVDAYKTD